MRISSNTKPMAAVLALSLVEERVLAMADPVERFVPELADRRVLRRLDGPSRTRCRPSALSLWRTC